MFVFLQKLHSIIISRHDLSIQKHGNIVSCDIVHPKAHGMLTRKVFFILKFYTSNTLMFLFFFLFPGKLTWERWAKEPMQELHGIAFSHLEFASRFPSYSCGTWRDTFKRRNLSKTRLHTEGCCCVLTFGVEKYFRWSTNSLSAAYSNSLQHDWIHIVRIKPWQLVAEMLLLILLFFGGKVIFYCHLLI